MITDCVLDFSELRSFCEEHREQLSSMKGACGGCPVFRLCEEDNKAFQIDSMMQMSDGESRFPRLLRYLRQHPNVMNGIPSQLFRSAYGTYHDTIGCPFQAREILSHLEECEKVYGLLTDEQSKLTWLNVLMHRLTLDHAYIRKAESMEPQYHILGFRGLSREEAFVDCGAFNGDSFTQYCRYNAPPRSAYLFEPDDKSRGVLLDAIAPYREETRVSVVDKGVHRSAGTLYFVSGKGLSSYLTENPVNHSVPVDVTSLDEAIQEEVSFIKMDIEGSEQNALLGAEKHILSSYPKLAICIYHSVKDLWEIPLLIRERFPGYTGFQIRHHSAFIVDTVLYVSR